MSPPFNGGTIQITGTDFGSDMGLITVLIYDDNGCAINCADPTLNIANSEALQCQFNGVGSSGVTRDVEIIVLNQNIKSSFTYDFDKGEITGIPVGRQSVIENENFQYNIGLTLGVRAVKDADAFAQRLKQNAEYPMMFRKCIAELKASNLARPPAGPKRISYPTPC